MEPLNIGTVLPLQLESEMRSSYMDYAMSVIVSRALPDARDGLKPVHRRILYAMQEQGMTPGARYQKCAAIIGEVLKHYHPHGDSAVYDSMVRMAQDFSLRYPLVDGQGNFGSIDGDSAAAYRYTEARLTRLAEEMLRDIDRETVDFQPNFDGGMMEPIVLTEIPFMVNKASMLERIAELSGDGKIDGVADLRDESNREGMRIVIELKKDAPGEVVLNQLYKQTPMQSTFGVNLLALVN